MKSFYRRKLCNDAINNLTPSKGIPKGKPLSSNEERA